MDYRGLAELYLDARLQYSRHPIHRELNGLADGELLALNTLILSGGCALPRELSEAMGVSTSRIAALLTDLEHKGLVLRMVDTKDRRRIHVYITDEGRAFTDDRRCHFLNVAAELFRRLGKSDSEEYVRIVSKIAELLKEDHRGAEDAGYARHTEGGHDD